jgi:hypothetical protein
MKSTVHHSTRSPVDCLEHEALRRVIKSPHGAYRLELRPLRLICYALNRSLVNKVVLVVSTMPVQHAASQKLPPQGGGVGLSHRLVRGTSYPYPAWHLGKYVIIKSTDCTTVPHNLRQAVGSYLRFGPRVVP